MSDLETKKKEVKRLSARAMKMKMDLHDLSEELPVNWQSIMEVAQATYDVFAQLEVARAELKSLQGE